MASTAHGTLSPNQVAEVDVRPGRDGIVVLNRSGEGAIWIRIDGEDPVVGAPDTYVCIGSRQFPISRSDLINSNGDLSVRLISTAATAYSVEAVGLTLKR